MEGTLAQIIIFAGNFAPQTWALCQGQILSISSNTALFSLLGTFYGGNGTVTFALPDLQGRTPVGIGQGPGLSPVSLGQIWGSESTTLSSGNMPAHNHIINASISVKEEDSSDDSPIGNVLALNNKSIFSTQAVNGSMVPGILTLAPNGTNLPIPLRKPYLGLNFIICTNGVYPSRP
ncbi:MAG TPA: tail fiber protein [Saprospiraceae bacterium]|nr:tail fiber protein [Saprospiraceae bacterium]HRG21734.1 tail fiber protein [Saprospiraceae bacterium]HRG66057.1 tail fiber protein [Saprospiraceae bacterium]